MSEPTAPTWPALTPEEAAENNGPRILIVGWVFTAAATLFVLGRVFSRFRKLCRIGAGDYLILLSLTLGYVYMSNVTVAVRAGSGRHVAALTPQQAERALFFTMVSFIPGMMSYMIPKFAVVILIKDLLNPSRTHEAVIWGLVFLNTLLIVLCIAFTYAQCDPTSALWTMAYGTKARCWDPVVVIATSIAASASSALFDFWLALYPAAVLWRMQINRRKKVALSTALGFGVCAGIVALYKCTTFKGAGTGFADFTYTSVNLVIWTSIEANSVIISACIPMLMPLVELIFGENFLSGGSRPQLRTIQTSHHAAEHEPGETPTPRARFNKEREDWQQQIKDAVLFPEGSSVDGSDGSGKSRG